MGAGCSLQLLLIAWKLFDHQCIVAWWGDPVAC